MIPISVPNLAGNEAAYLAQCVETGYVSSVGSFVGQFANAVASLSGGGHCAPVASGTAGLHLALLAAGVKQDDLVILPSLTFIASANAVSYCRAVPWLMDISANSWTLDPHQLARMMETETRRENGVIIHQPSGRRVAAIMPVYMLGLPADMDPINDVATHYDIPVIADAAAALGATYKGQPLSNLGAFATAYSFNGNKTFTCGGGGGVTSQNEKTVQYIDHLATTARCGPGYDHDHIGYNYRMTNLSAAVGSAQLEQFEQFLAKKRQISHAYDHAFQTLDMLSTFPNPEWATSANWLSGIVVDLPKESITSFVKGLQSAGIDARAFWRPIHLQAPYSHAEKTDLPVTEQIYEKIVPLPCSTGLDEETISRVIEIVTKVASNY
jgi:perosamine synthetase